MAIVRFRQDPLRALEELNDELTSSFFAPFPGCPVFGRRPSMPVIDVSEDNANIYVEAELPGMEKKDVEVRLRNGNILSINARKDKKEEWKRRNYYRTETYYGEYHREIELPKEINEAGIKATVKDGVLSITLPKKTVEKAVETPIRVE